VEIPRLKTYHVGDVVKFVKSSKLFNDGKSIII
jgi:hypothetical protein